MQAVDSRAAELIASPQFDLVARHLAAGFSAVQENVPRLASLFATQQRWLMSHVALARHFRGVRMGRPGLSRRDFLDDLQPFALASRNTCASFFAEALHYGITQPCQADGQRGELVEPAPATLSALTEWFALHLAALDSIEPGGRLALLRQHGGALLTAIQPLVADELMCCTAIRRPPPAYGVFASVDDGGSLMDRLIVGLDPGASRHQERALTNVTSVSALARPLNLSRTHAGRTLAAAAAAGALGWSGRPGRSPIWLSRAFRAEYAQMQALKLAIIDAALAVATDGLKPAAIAADWRGRSIEGAWDNPSH